jgi:hypothetical protein
MAFLMALSLGTQGEPITVIGDGFARDGGIVLRRYWCIASACRIKSLGAHISGCRQSSLRGWMVGAGWLVAVIAWMDGRR